LPFVDDEDDASGVDGRRDPASNCWRALWAARRGGSGTARRGRSARRVAERRDKDR